MRADVEPGAAAGVCDNQPVECEACRLHRINLVEFLDQRHTRFSLYERLNSMMPLRGLVIGGAALSAGVLVLHAWVSITSAHDVNLVSGVWLALAHDLREGLFYRDLIGPAGYGGTRYFPLFFTLIAAAMRVGVDPIWAGHVVSLVGLGVLIGGAFVLLARLGLPTRDAIPITVLAAAPYFVQQTAYSIRVEPLAAGLALCGLASIVTTMRHATAPARSLVVAVVFFLLAIAAKPTSLYAPAAAVIALVLARRVPDAVRLGSMTALAVLALVATVDWTSGGRFLVALRATALAGASPGTLLTMGTVLRPFALIATSHVLTVIVVLAVAALSVSPATWRQLPVIVLATGAATTTIALATPGTILTNQFVELYVLIVVFLGWFQHEHLRIRPAGAAVLAFLLVWTAAQNVRRTVGIRSTVENTETSQRSVLADALATCGEPVLSESPLLPVLARQNPILLDPFAFLVVRSRVPGAEDDLVARLSAGQFSCVVLEQNPETPQGAAWYRRVHLGPRVLEAIRRHYEYRTTIGGHRFYIAAAAVPDRSGAPAVQTRTATLE